MWRVHLPIAALALVAGMLLALFPLMPVMERTLHYSWSSTEGDVEVPLNPYRPAGITVTISGDVPEGPLMETVRSADPMLQEQTLELERRGDELVARIGGASVSHSFPEKTTDPLYLEIDEQALVMTSTPGRVDTTEEHSIIREDHRPAIDSLALTPEAQAAGTRIDVSMRADTRFDTRPTRAKIIVGVAAGVMLMAAFVLLAWAAPRRPPPSSRWRPRWEDAAVLFATAFGVVAGGATDDDGFIRLIAGTAETNGFIGNYVRWNNVPEAPFGWQYQIIARLGETSWEPVWLRLWPWVLALVGWGILRHGLLPRLIPGAGRWSRVALTATFLLGWLVYGNSLRPELFFAVGTAIVLLLVLDAHTRESLVPLVLACAVASWTIGTGPTGLWAVTPLILAAPMLWRWIRRRPVWEYAAAGLLGLASLGSVFLAMFADQSLGTVIAATDARTAYGPIYPVWMDPLRYFRLFMSFATRQIVTYWAVLALGAVLVLVAGRRLPRVPGVDVRACRLMVWTALALVPVMAVSPTKLPHHFGALILIGPLAAGVVVHVMLADEPPERLRPWLTGALVGLTAAFTGLAFHRANTWWKLGTLGHIADTKPLAVAGVPLWPGLVAAGIALGIVAWWTKRRRRAIVRFWAVVLVVAQVGFTVGTFANTAQAMARRDPLTPGGPYTLGAAALDAMRADGCRLEESLAVELDPAAGVLDLEPAAEQRMRTDPGIGLPVWRAEGNDLFDSGWIDIPDAVSTGELPIVIPVAGADEAHRVQVEYDDGTTEDLDPILKFLGTSDYSDIRIHPPKGATAFRVVAESDGPATWRRNILDGAPAPGPNGEPVDFAIAAPRVPEVTPFTDLVDDATVATAWNLAFFTPCLDQPAPHPGTVEIPDFILSDSERPGSIAFQSKNGGPFASAIGLREPARIPLYVPGDHDESALNALDLIELQGPDMPDLTPSGNAEAPRSGWNVGPDIALPGAGGS